MPYNVLLYLWKADITVAKAKKKNVDDDNTKLFSPFQDQSSPQLTMKMEGSTAFKEIDAKQNYILLLRLIREVTCGVEQHL